MSSNTIRNGVTLLIHTQNFNSGISRFGLTRTAHRAVTKIGSCIYGVLNCCLGHFISKRVFNLALSA